MTRSHASKKKSDSRKIIFDTIKVGPIRSQCYPIRAQSLTVGENSDTSKEARYLKTDTEPPGDMHTPMTTVRNKACPPRLLGGHSGDT